MVDSLSYPANGVDAGYYTVYVITGVTAPADEFAGLQPILSSALASFRFTDSYIRQGVSQINWETEQAQAIGKTLSEAADSYNDAWHQRNKVNDALSQKRSDATLGYETLKDPVTGETYKADAGFYDEYAKNKDDWSNPNLELVKDNDYDAYSQPVSGYISNQ